MIILIVMTTVVVVGLVAMLLAEPHARPRYPVWTDELERRLLNERKIRAGWW